MSTSMLAVVPAVNALATAVRAAIEEAEETVQVIVGARGNVIDDDFVMIAAPTDGGAGVLISPTPSDQGHQQGAGFSIVVLISSYSANSDDVAGRMTRAQELLDLFTNAVQNDSTLGDVVAVADVGDTGQLATISDEHGCAVEFAVTVDCEVY